MYFFLFFSDFWCMQKWMLIFKNSQFSYLIKENVYFLFYNKESKMASYVKKELIEYMVKMEAPFSTFLSDKPIPPFLFISSMFITI